MKEEPREAELDQEQPREEEGPMFLQAFVPGTQDRLMIPHDFLTNIIHEELVGADISSPLGTWHIKVERIASSYYFTEGWPDFVFQHGLRIGHFLVFCHQGSMNFSVLVLDESFCQRFYDPPPVHDHDKGLQETQCDANSCGTTVGIDTHDASPSQKTSSDPKEQHRVTFRTTIRPCNLAAKCFLYIPVYFKEAIGISDQQTRLLLRDENQELWLVQVRRSAKNRTMLSDGWEDFCSSHQLRPGDVCQFHPTADNIQGIKIVQVLISEQPEDYREKVIKALKTTGTDLAAKRFWITLSPYNFNDYLVQIPNAFSEAMQMSNMRGVFLVDQKNESFYVELMHTTRSRTFFVSTGWRELSCPIFETRSCLYV